MAKSMQSKKGKKPGRPTLFMGEEHCLMAREYSGNGKTIVQLAEAIGVHPSTVFEWQHIHPSFADAFTQGREAACDSVEAALFKRAMGYSVKTTKFVVVGGKVQRHDVMEHYPPDVAAIKFFLTNRDPAHWKERQEVKHEGKITLEQVLAQSSQLPANVPPAEK